MRNCDTCDEPQDDVTCNRCLRARVAALEVECDEAVRARDTKGRLLGKAYADNDGMLRRALAAEVERDNSDALCTMAVRDAAAAMGLIDRLEAQVEEWEQTCWLGSAYLSAGMSHVYHDSTRDAEEVEAKHCDCGQDRHGPKCKLYRWLCPALAEPKP